MRLEFDPMNAGKNPKGSESGDGKISVLVISRSATNLSDLFVSIKNSKNRLPAEILVAWNGAGEPDTLLKKFPDLAIKIHRIEPYNFASNNNRLADLAQGEILLFVNDDIILDPHCLHSACEALKPDAIGVVGARLRYPDGPLQHAGIFFKDDGTPYHRYKHLLKHDDPIFAESFEVPAVTGAFMMVKSEDFQQVRFNESYRVCGEDVAFCLRFTRITGKAILYEASATAVHNEGLTRRITGERLTPQDDLERIKAEFRSASTTAGGSG